MEFRILGHLEVLSDGRRLELGGPKQRAVLASLVVEIGNVVSIDRLSDHLWGGRPPVGRYGTLHAYVSHLRRVLEPDRLPGVPGRVVVTRGSGYLLDIDRDQLDAGRFERLAGQGRRALHAGHFEEAEGLLSAALALWRGQALADFIYQPFAQAMAARLEQRRVEVLEDRIDVALAGGRHGAAVAELEPLVTAHPFRERLCGQLMLALYRSGRQAEALRAYEVTRRLLRAELDTEPGPALKALQLAILRQEPILDWRPPGKDGASTLGRSGGKGEPTLTGSAAPALFLGRVAELAVLEAALKDTRRGVSRVVLVAGELGAGKTRLVEELAARAMREGADVVWGHACEGDGVPAFWPWVQIIRTLLETADTEIVADASATWAGELVRVVPEIAGAVPGVEWPDALRPEETLVRLFEAVSGLLLRLATGRPLVLILDDLHAADADSLALLRLCSSRPTSAPVLVVGCYRDTDIVSAGQRVETLDGLGSEPLVTRLLLGGLGRDDVACFMAQALGRKPKRGLVNAVHDRTEGNPFFVAELTRLIRDEGFLDDAAGATLPRVPTGVRDLTRHRLTWLPETARQLLEAAAVAGREFDVDLVAQVTGMAPEQSDHLAASVLTGWVTAASPDASGRWRFSHSLIRDALYDGLPALRRACLHRRIAEALEEIHGPGGGVHSVEIAHHFWEAARGGAREQAFESALQASDWASSQGAYEQAEEQLVRACEVFHRLPAGPRRDQSELALQLRLSSLLSIRKGYGVPQVGHACQRAGELCGQLGDADELLWSLIRLGAFYSVRLHTTQARQVGARLLDAARRSRDPRFLVAGHLRLGVTAFHEGHLRQAKGHLEKVTACLTTVDESSLGAVFVEHPAVKAYGYEALIVWLEGDHRQATVLTNRTLGLARRLHDPYTLGFGLFLAAWVAAFRGQTGAVHRYAGELRALADERGFRLLAASAQVLTGWASAEQGAAEEGLVAMTDGLAAVAGTGVRTMRPFFLGLLARAYRRAGRLEDGLSTLAEALAEVKAGGERFAEAELHRLQGDFLASRSLHRGADAEISLRRALSVARSQGAVALERRALTSATRLAKQPARTGCRPPSRQVKGGQQRDLALAAPAT